jgi:hypothetical protein
MPIARLLAFNGLIATDPMMPPFLENWSFARPDAEAQLA